MPMRKVQQEDIVRFRQEDIIRFIQENIIHHFGTPQIISINKRTIFTREVTISFVEAYGIKLMASTLY